MRIALRLSALRQMKWHEPLIRFAFGGAIAVVAALLGRRFGAHFGGLFLAFPAILPASLTLVSAHDGRKKAADDAAGAACGATGLAAFALVVWAGGRRAPLPLVLTLATAAWLAISYLAWHVLNAHSSR